MSSTEISRFNSYYRSMIETYFKAKETYAEKLSVYPEFRQAAFCDMDRIWIEELIQYNLEISMGPCVTTTSDHSAPDGGGEGSEPDFPW